MSSPSVGRRRAFYSAAMPALTPLVGPDGIGPWHGRFAALGAAFHTEQPAAGVPAPHWVACSDACARALGRPDDWWQRTPAALAVFSGQAVWPGMRPLASVYSGHQFGQWAGQLGDGRALLLGEIDTPQGLQEVQLKGSGPTPYSRRGDGRAVLRSSVRELLASEAMAALAQPTTRALCLVGSALPVQREQVETAAVLTRVAPSFIRFGHFEHFAHHGLHDELRVLTDFVIRHFYPACAEAPQPALALLTAVARRTAELVAGWQSLGFCHGVMNTDNMSILGLTLDYGPFGFMDGFDPHHICNHSDTQGRYAFSRQPQIAWWNLQALAQALVPLCRVGDAREPLGQLLGAALSDFGPHFAACMNERMRAKLGLALAQEGDAALANDWLRLLASQRVDHTLAWRHLALVGAHQVHTPPELADLFSDVAPLRSWLERYRQRLRQDSRTDAQRGDAMRLTNPKYVLRNHLAQTAIAQAEAGRFERLHELLRLLDRPFDEQPDHDADAAPAPEWAAQLCVSCSS